MGPPTYIGGNYLDFGSKRGKVNASMGPPTYIGGNNCGLGIW